MPKNIDSIELWDLEKHGDTKNYNDMRPVIIQFKFPCTWTTLNIEDLKKILELWIIGEEEKYPQSKGFEGRGLLLKEILRVFKDVPIN